MPLQGPTLSPRVEDPCRGAAAYRLGSKAQERALSPSRAPPPPCYPSLKGSLSENSHL